MAEGFLQDIWYKECCSNVTFSFEENPMASVAIIIYVNLGKYHNKTGVDEISHFTARYLKHRIPVREGKKNVAHTCKLSS